MSKQILTRSAGPQWPQHCTFASAAHWFYAGISSPYAQVTSTNISGQARWAYSRYLLDGDRLVRVPGYRRMSKQRADLHQQAVEMALWLYVGNPV